jgi:hypothetical protein
VRIDISDRSMFSSLLHIQDSRKKPGFDSKSLFLTHKYLGETGFAEFALVSPDIVNLQDLLMQIKYTPSIGVNSPYPY